jgi:hypothetical protein
MRHVLKKFIIFLAVSIGLSLTAFAAGNETVDTRIEIISTTPVVESIVLDDVDNTTDSVIDLSPNATELVNCYGFVNDTDGLTDLINLTARIYSSGIGTSAPGFESADTNLTSYTNTSCDLSQMTTNGFFNCTFNMQFYATNTTWTCNVNVTDFAFNSNTTGLNATRDVDDLIAIDITNGTIDFGQRSLNTNYTADTNITVHNEGNIQLDLQLDAYEANATGTVYDSASAFNCTVGQVPVENLRFNTTFNGVYDGSLSMSQGGFTTYNTFDFNHQTAGRFPTSTLTHWAVGIPTTGLSGICTGRIIYVALASGG